MLRRAARDIWQSLNPGAPDDPIPLLAHRGPRDNALAGDRRHYAAANQGLVLLTWDETEGATTQPFIAIGPHVKAGYRGTALYNLSSVLKSVQEIFEVTPLLGHAADATTNDLSDLFVAGSFP